MTKHNLHEQFTEWDAERRPILDRVRECAKRTIPSVMPDPANVGANARLPDNYQSDGARYVSTFAGRLLQGTFPPGVPYAARHLSKDLLDDPAVPVESKQRLLEELAIRNATIVAFIENSPRFYATKYSVMKNLIVCGDVTERMNDDGSITMFRMDNYVTLRDSTGTVLCQVFRENLDIASLTVGELDELGIKESSFRQKRIDKRLVTKYVRNEWNPWSRTWVQLPGIMYDGKMRYFDEQEDRVSAYWTTPFDLTEGENYGRGLCEINFGDIVMVDTGAHAFSNWLELSSWFKMCIDDASDINEDDLSRENGTTMRCKVMAGAVQDMALFKADKLADFTVAEKVTERVSSRLGKAFLSETASVRDSERTTLGEITQTTIQELQNATNGAFATLSAFQQLPMFLRAEHQLVTDRRLKPIPEKLEGKAVRTAPLTGLAALAAQTKFQNVVRVAELAQQLQAEDDIDKSVFLNAAARYMQVDEPGLVKTAEQKKAEMDAIMARQAQARAIDAVGTIAENRAKDQGVTTGG